MVGDEWIAFVEGTSSEEDIMIDRSEQITRSKTKLANITSISSCAEVKELSGSSASSSFDEGTFTNMCNVSRWNIRMLERSDNSEWWRWNVRCIGVDVGTGSIFSSGERRRRREDGGDRCEEWLLPF